MSARSRAGSNWPGAVWHLAAAVLVAILALILFGWLDAAPACPPMAKSHHAAAQSQAKAAAAKTEVRQAFRPVRPEAVRMIGHCCAGPSSSASSSCQSAGCSAAVAFADAAPAAMDQMDLSTAYFIPGPGFMTGHAPPARFRPPRRAI
jgi:hypothetical protein